MELTLAFNRAHPAVTPATKQKLTCHQENLVIKEHKIQ